MIIGAVIATAVVTMTSPSSPPAGCTVLADFESVAQRDAWFVVNDNVMGGRSEGGLTFVGDRLLFSGNINTNGGGFSSIRAALAPGTLSDAKAIWLKVKSDGRDYNLTLRTTARFRGRTISFRGDVSPPSADEDIWVEIPFGGLVPTIFGRTVPAPPFNASDVRSIGFIISDGTDGPFQLQISEIVMCTSTSDNNTS